LAAKTTEATDWRELREFAAVDLTRSFILSFPLCEGIESDKIQADPDPMAMVAQLGHGAIDGVRRLADGRYEISGAFGVVLVDAERPIMRLKGP